ncbi:nuclear transport factor 2 family protein [Salipiger mucosus]|uniref:SnoaL-like domain-containing protein n=1 Tax=Salipiger mucosus DSM 16094 TaxID=1123237 RepID=S9RD32_9RHOB|nr:nuclear transport factor 2 family protein [Salipiger mucosus]EPX76030.1 hypothetical protein Salmuc_00682 [Salipiger mucosus DSM 16094]
MSLKSVADELVAGCREGREAENLDRLYAEDAVSVEAFDMPGGAGRETRGRAGIHGKHEWWAGAFETHSAEVAGPFLHGEDRFAVIFVVDATELASGTRMQMQEIGLYTVAGDRIVREEFFGLPQ